MSAVDAGLIALVATMAIVAAAGVAAAARHAGLPSRQAPQLAAGVAAAVVAWLVVAAGLAGAGLLSRYDAAPPRVALLPLAFLTTMLLVSRTDAFARLLEGAPPAWPIALQTFRLPVELLLWSLFQEGRIPERMTFGGRNFDVLIGLTAPLVAWAVSRGRMGRTAVAAWNVLGLGLLANVVVIALRSVPGPLNAGWGGVQNTVIAEVPYVWLPAFLVPLAVFGHVASLRQLLASPRQGLATSRAGRG